METNVRESQGDFFLFLSLLANVNRDLRWIECSIQFLYAFVAKDGK